MTQNQTFRIVIVEDEPAAVSQLQLYLNQLNFNYEVLTIIETVSEGIEWFNKNIQADLIFSDIQLADGISFEIFERVKISAPVIFATAFDAYAIRAFKHNSIDYILKPIDLESVRFSVIKFQNQALVSQDKLQEFFKIQEFPSKNYKKSFLIKNRGKLLPIKSIDFAYFFIQNSIVFGQLYDDRKYVLDFKLEELEVLLDPQVFIRANRQFILSRGCITVIKPFINSRVIVEVNPSSTYEIVISKNKVRAFKRWYENG